MLRGVNAEWLISSDYDESEPCLIPKLYYHLNCTGGYFKKYDIIYIYICGIFLRLTQILVLNTRCFRLRRRRPTGGADRCLGGACEVDQGQWSGRKELGGGAAGAAAQPACETLGKC